jgi:hypothetical protein
MGQPEKGHLAAFQSAVVLVTPLVLAAIGAGIVAFIGIPVLRLSDGQKSLSLSQSRSSLFPQKSNFQYSKNDSLLEY